MVSTEIIKFILFNFFIYIQFSDWNKKFTYNIYNRFLYVIQKNNPIVICNMKLIIK